MAQHPSKASLLREQPKSVFEDLTTHPFTPVFPLFSRHTEWLALLRTSCLYTTRPAHARSHVHTQLLTDTFTEHLLRASALTESSSTSQLLHPQDGRGAPPDCARSPQAAPAIPEHLLTGLSHGGGGLGCGVYLLDVPFLWHPYSAKALSTHSFVCWMNKSVRQHSSVRTWAYPVTYNKTSWENRA